MPIWIIPPRDRKLGKTCFMAKVMAPYVLRGSIGDLTFCQNEFGNHVKAKGGPSPEQVKQQARFANTRRNAAEWQRVTAAARLLRAAVACFLPSVKSMRLSGRMNGLLLEVLRSDRAHDWGERVVGAGGLSVLAGFDFNPDRPLSDILPVALADCYSLESGKVVVHVPAFRLRRKNSLPKGATHFRLVSCLATMDFEKGTFKRDPQSSGLYKQGNKAGAAFAIEHLVPPSHAAGSIWLLGIEFYSIPPTKYTFLYP